MKNIFGLCFTIGLIGFVWMGCNRVFATSTYDVTVDTFTRKFDLGEAGASATNIKLKASHINDLQDAVNSIERKLGTQTSTTTLNALILSNYLTVQGTSTFSGKISTLTVDAATINGYLIVGGSISFSNAVTTLGTTTIQALQNNGWMVVMGSSTFMDAISTITVQAVYDKGYLVVSGSSTFMGTLSTITVQAQTVNGYSMFNGTVAFNSPVSTIVPAAITNSGYFTQNGTSTFYGAIIATTTIGGYSIDIPQPNNITFGGTARVIRQKPNTSTNELEILTQGGFTLLLNSNGGKANLQSWSGANAYSAINLDGPNQVVNFAMNKSTAMFLSGASGMPVTLGSTTIDGGAIVNGYLIVQGTTNITGSGGGGGTSARGYVFRAPGDAFISTSTNLGIDWDAKPYSITVSSGRLTARVAPRGGGSSYTFCVDGSTASMPTFHLPSNTTSQITPVVSFTVTIASYSTVGLWCMGTGSSTAASDVWMQLYGSNP